MNLTQRILISAIVPAMFLPGAASASILANAHGAASGPFTGPTNIDGFGSNAATARITAFPVGGSFSNVGFSSTEFGDPACLFCGQSMDARVTGDGTGTVKLFSGVGMTPNTRGIAEARLDLDDIIVVDSSPFEISLDTFFAQLQRGPLTVCISACSTNAFFEMGLTLYEIDTGNSYSVALHAGTSFQNVPSINIEYWDIQESVGPGNWVTVNGGSSIASLAGHLGFSRTLSLSSGSWSVAFFADSAALCVGGPPGNCLAIFDGWNTSYLGFQGSFTSENGYQYLGVPGQAAAVPEPGTLSLLFPLACGILLVRRKKA